MNRRSNWFVLGLAVLLVLVTGSAKIARGYQYVELGPDGDNDEYETTDSYTSTHTSEASADASGDAGDSYCTASVRTYSWAKDGDSAAPEASAWGSWGNSWEWDGPPSTAPGGTLRWVANGGGDMGVSGATDPGDTGSALSVASASGSSGGSGSEGAGGDGWGNVFGYVTDSDQASTDASSGSTDNNKYANENPGYGQYDCDAGWEFNDSDNTDIPEGTAYVWYSGGASCDTYSGAGAGPYGSGAEAGSSSSASADVYLSAGFP